MRRLLFAAVLVAAMLPIPLGADPALVKTARAFVDAIGMNVHIAYYGEPDGDSFDSYKQLLYDLKIVHLRSAYYPGDGLLNPRINELYANGGIRQIGGMNIAQTGADVLGWPGIYDPGVFEGYEGPNEYDVSGDPSWDTTLRSFMTGTLWPNRTTFPVICPPMAFSWANGILGDMSASCTYSNMHVYIGGRHPETGAWGDDGYASIDPYQLNWAAFQAAGKPMYTSETGYWTDTAMGGHVSEDIQARYLPRLLLYEYKKGFSRMYIYEFIDKNTPGIENWSGFGLLRSDLSPKPAYTAIKNLMTTLSDPGEEFTPTPLGYSLSGNDADVQDIVFQKRDGTYWLALWVGSSGWDPDAFTPISVPTQSVTVTVPSTHKVVSALTWADTGIVTTTPITPTTSQALTITDKLTIVQIQPDARPIMRRRMR